MIDLRQNCNLKTRKLTDILIHWLVWLSLWLPATAAIFEVYKRMNIDQSV